MLFDIQNDPELLSSIGNDDRILRSKFFVVCKCPGGSGTLLTTKCLAPPELIIYQMSGFTGGWGEGEGMLVAGIDLHINGTYTGSYCQFLGKKRTAIYSHI